MGDFEKLMQRAHLTNLQRERDERAAGLATPTDGGAMDLMVTAMMAIEAGIRCDDWNAIAEALDMLLICKGMVVVVGKVRRDRLKRDGSGNPTSI